MYNQVEIADEYTLIKKFKNYVKIFNDVLQKITLILHNNCKP